MPDLDLCFAVDFGPPQRGHHVLCDKPKGHSGDHGSGPYSWPVRSGGPAFQDAETVYELDRLRGVVRSLQAELRDQARLVGEARKIVEQHAEVYVLSGDTDAHVYVELMALLEEFDAAGIVTQDTDQ